jgi:hypothetical protein
METITKKVETLKNIESKDVAKFISCDAKDYKPDKKEITFTISSSPNKLCFRLVHNGKVVSLYEENDCKTDTGLIMFCGTEDECKKEAEKVGLVLPETAGVAVRINKIIGN